MKKPYLVGITGGSGSGKTYFLSRLMEKIGTQYVTFISQDNYYRPREEQPIDQNGVVNFDTPLAIDYLDFKEDVVSLCEGRTVKKKEYTYNNPNAVAQYLTFEPRPIIILEGLFVFYNREIYEMLDLKIFIDATFPTKIRRRIIRDNKERGYDIEDVLYRYERHVLPAYERYVHPFKDGADLVIPNNQSCDVAIEVIVNHINQQI